MLESRTHRPVPGELLYHYCDASAFLSICSSKKLRFSDVFLMNDAVEQHYGYAVWEAAASQLLDSIGQPFLDRIDEVLHSAGFLGLPTVSSHSLKGDLLSQWRAYADGGRGYAIGFDANEMQKLPCRMTQVLYDRDQQIDELKSAITALHERHQKVADESAFAASCFHLAFDLSCMKHPAFAEENEVRMMHLLDFVPSNSFLKLTTRGGACDGQPVADAEVSFRMRSNCPVAYVDLDFTCGRQINPVREVLIGPMNDARPTGISIFLETLGIPEVQVRRSSAPLC